MLKLSILLFLLGKIISEESKNIIEGNKSLETSYFDGKNERHNSIVLYSGIGKENEKEKISLEFNLGYTKVLIGDKKRLKWGIRCDESYLNTCQLKSSIKQKSEYFDNKYEYLEALVYLRLSENEELFINNKALLNINLITKSDDWSIGNSGVIGLHPTSDYIHYLKNLYIEEDLRIKINFLSNEKKMSLKKNYEMEIILNSDNKKETEKIRLDFNDDYYLEPISSLLLKKDEEEDYVLKDVSMCISTVGEELLYFENAEEICNVLKLVVCEDLNNCTKNTAELKESSNLEIKIKEEIFSFVGEDYFYFSETEELKCRFGNRDFQTNGQCSKISTLVIGKPFIEKYPLTIVYTTDKKNSLIFFYQKDNGKSGILIWLIFGFVASLICFVILIYICCFKKKEKEDYELYIPVSN